MKIPFYSFPPFAGWLTQKKWGSKHPRTDGQRTQGTGFFSLSCCKCGNMSFPKSGKNSIRNFPLNIAVCFTIMFNVRAQSLKVIPVYRISGKNVLIH